MTVYGTTNINLAHYSYIHTYTYIRAYTHTCIHTYMQTYMLPRFSYTTRWPAISRESYKLSFACN